MDCSGFKFPQENSEPAVEMSEDREKFTIRFGSARDGSLHLTHKEARDLVARLDTGDRSVCGQNITAEQARLLAESLTGYFLPDYS